MRFIDIKKKRINTINRGDWISSDKKWVDKKVSNNIYNLDFCDYMGSSPYFYNFNNISDDIGLASYLCNYKTLFLKMEHIGCIFWVLYKYNQ